LEGNINLDLIIDGCLSGYRGSQKRLYEHFYGYAMSIALRYAHDREDAREILNDSFFKVFKFLERYDKERPFKAWLRRIVVNAAIDHQRRHKVEFSMVDIDEVQIEDDSVAPVIPSEIDVLPILQRLSPQYRTVFNLYVFEGYKHDEIAEKLGISVGTSRSNLLRAKAKLKSWLTDYSSNAKAN
jgi:RNA polymerase sigma-70 factor (ECF subfamily)